MAKWHRPCAVWGIGLSACVIIFYLELQGLNLDQTPIMKYRGGNFSSNYGLAAETLDPTDAKGSSPTGVPNTNKITTDSSAQAKKVVCTQQQRLERIDEMCERFTGAHATYDTTRVMVDSMTDTELKLLVRDYFVVPEFKIIGCLNWKTGITTWRGVLAHNSFRQRYNMTDPYQAYENLLKANATGQMRQMIYFPAREIRTMLKTYWKFMTLRHPLARLISAYTDKIVGVYGRDINPKIKSAVRGNNVTEEELNSKSPPAFREFLQYISEGGTDIMRPDDGGHWHTLMSRCKPCVINYDHVVRIETFQEDAAYIVNHKMKARGLDYKVNVRQNAIPIANVSNFEMIIDEYMQIPDELLQTLVTTRYKQDLYVYGYNFTRMEGGKVLTQCSSGYNNGQECC